MSATATESFLQANITKLRVHNADLAEILLDAQASTSIEFVDTPQAVPAALLSGRQLCSRRRPIDEASRLVDSIDLVEHAVVVVLGFGVGHHVRALAERLGNLGIIIVFEPDVALLRSVFERVDHSSWLGSSRVCFTTDVSDRAGLAARLHNCEAVLAQGVAFLEHPPSKLRLGKDSARFMKLVAEQVTAAQVTMLTTLTRTVDTVRNLLLNVGHYAVGDGIADMKNAAWGYPAITVAAGPSLQKNIHLLARPGIRDRCVVIAAQTVLKPLLAAGIKPHFVTALDFHELSARFYEGLRDDDVRGVTLVADPKVHPSVLDLYPGQKRCIGSSFLDRVLGDHAREMGSLPPGSTVAHLSLYLAKYLGCNPIAMIGQDLGFPDGLYYASGNAVHDVWAPELNPFNTMEMMEWQRIRRFRQHLHKTTDVHGKPIYTDSQMMTYLRQFERDFREFAREGVRVIDATEGGVAKQHTTAMPLHNVIERYIAGDAAKLPPLPGVGASPQQTESVARSVESSRRSKDVRERISSIRRDIAVLRETSRKTASLLRRMLEEQHDGRKMERHFRKLQLLKRDVEKRMPAFEMLSQINQSGMFRRLKADRKLSMSRDLPPLERQRAEIERDLDNVTWYAEAAEEMVDQLLGAERVLDPTTDRTPARNRPAKSAANSIVAPRLPGIEAVTRTRVAALVPVDPDRNGMGIRRSLTEDFFGTPVLQATLDRLGRCRLLEEIVLLAPRGFNVDALIDRDRIRIPLAVEECAGSPFGHEHESIAAARLWCPSSWRGGVAGMSAYDEVLCPQVMHPVMQRRGITAALLVGPDWPLVDPSSESGCDAVIARHLEDPKARTIVFTQAPPGLCGCVVSAPFMADLATRNRLATIGGRLVYQPQMPQSDPISKAANVQIDHRVRNSMIRATFDSPRLRNILRGALQDVSDLTELSGVAITAAIERHMAEHVDHLPQHIVLELSTARQSRGLFAASLCNEVDRESMPVHVAAEILEQCGASSDTVVTLAGAGDPLLHPAFDTIIGLAKEFGIAGVHVRTELRASQDVLDRLIDSGAHVISVDLHADCAATYQQMMGEDCFKQTLMNIEYCLERRRRLTDNSPAAALSIPWLVPRLQRRAETYGDLESFFDRWQHVLGTALIEGVPDHDFSESGGPPDTLTKPQPPRQVIEREVRTHMTILSDGSVPLRNTDLRGADCVGNVRDGDISSLWKRLVATRSAGQDGGVVQP